MIFRRNLLVVFFVSLFSNYLLAGNQCPVGALSKHTNCIEVKDINWLKNYTWSSGIRSQLVNLPEKQDYAIKITCTNCLVNKGGNGECEASKWGARVKIDLEDMPSIYSLRYIESFEFSRDFSNVQVARYFSFSDIPTRIKVSLKDLPLNNKACYTTNGSSVIERKSHASDLILPYGAPRLNHYSYASRGDSFSMRDEKNRRDSWNSSDFTYGGRKYLWSETIDLPKLDLARDSNSRMITRVPEWSKLNFVGKGPSFLYEANETFNFDSKYADREMDFYIYLRNLAKDEDADDIVEYFEETSNVFLNPSMKGSEVKFFLAMELANFSRLKANQEPEVYLYMTTGPNDPPVRFKRIEKNTDVANSSKRSLLMDIVLAGSVAQHFMGQDYNLILQPIVEGAHEGLSAIKDHQIEKPFLYMFSHFENIAADEIAHIIEGVENPLYANSLKTIRDNIDQMNGKWYSMSSMESGYLTIRQQARLIVHPLQKARMQHRQRLNADPFIDKWIDIMIQNAVTLSATASTGDVAVENLKRAANFIQVAEFTHPNLKNLELPEGIDPVAYLQSIMTSEDYSNFDSNLQTMKQIITGNSTFKSREDFNQIIDSLN